MAIGAFFMPKNSVCAATKHSCYDSCVTIYYKTEPQTYEELVDSVRGQLERMREVSITNETMPEEEKVVITTQSFMSLLDRVEELSQLITVQAELFVAIQGIFVYLFTHLGLPTDSFEDDEEDYEDD